MSYVDLPSALAMLGSSGSLPPAPISQFGQPFVPGNLPPAPMPQLTLQGNLPPAGIGPETLQSALQRDPMGTLAQLAQTSTGGNALLSGMAQDPSGIQSALQGPDYSQQYGQVLQDAMQQMQQAQPSYSPMQQWGMNYAQNPDQFHPSGFLSQGQNVMGGLASGFAQSMAARQSMQAKGEQSRAAMASAAAQSLANHRWSAIQKKEEQGQENINSLVQATLKRSQTAADAMALPDDVAKTLGLPQGFKVAPERYDSLVSAASTADRMRNPQKYMASVQNKDNQEPTDYGPDVMTTMSGLKYMSAGAYQGKDRTAAQNWARDNKIPMVSAPEDDALKQIDTARLNLTSMFNEVKSTLPVDPKTNLLTIPNRKLSEWLKLNPTLASFGTWRSSAIQAMRAAAGSKGLRINQAEILMSAANDLTQIGDNIPSAMKRIQVMLTQLDDSEKSVLVKDRSTLPASLGISGGIPPRLGSTTPAASTQAQTPMNAATLLGRPNSSPTLAGPDTQAKSWFDQQAGR